MNTTRRGFIKAVSGTFAGFTVLKWTNAIADTKPGVPTNPGNRFNTPVFAAFIDTIVPGADADPTGAPGAKEAGTLEYLDRLDKAKFVPISMDHVHLLVEAALNTESVLTRFCTFDRLPLADRQKIVEGIEWVPATSLLLKLIRAPFYTASVNSVGYEYTGFAGPNNGFTDYSFKEQISHSQPEVINGNLP